MEDDRQNEMVTAARVWAESDAKAYLEGVEQGLREGELADLHLSITTSVAMHADVAETLLRMAGHGEYLDEIESSGGDDLIALATHGQGGLQRWAVGSVTERLLGTTKLPLLVVRPASGGESC
jgi:nucleotide-binding universal stress UspA family protein